MSKRPDTWMPLYVGDYLADTMHLTQSQHGAYLLLIMAYWRNGTPLADDNVKLAAITKSTASEWKKLRPVMAEFFSIDGGYWRHKRIEAELTAAATITDQRSSAGKASAAAKAQRKAQQTGNENSTPVDAPLQRNDQQNAIPSPSPSQKKDSDANASGGSSPPFDPVKDLWSRGIGILGEKHRSLLGKFVKTYGQVPTLAAIVECEKEQPVDPAAYFVACLERGKANAGNGSAASGNAKLAAWARAEVDEPESFRGSPEAAH